MNIVTTRVGAEATLAVSGSIDVEHGYEVYQAAVAEAVAGHSAVTLDLADVDFIDSVGLGMLIRTRDELTRDYESGVSLRNPSAYVTRLLELTGLQGQFPTTP